MNTRDIAITALGASILVGGISYLFFIREDEDSKMLKKDRRARAELLGIPYEYEDEDDDYDDDYENNNKLQKRLDQYRGLDDDDDSDLSYDSLLRLGGQKRKKTKKAMSRKKKTKKGLKRKKGTKGKKGIRKKIK